MKHKTAVAIQHVAFEDVGNLSSVLKDNNFDLRSIHATQLGKRESLIQQPDLLIILGGPIGANDHENYPFLNREMDIILDRIERNLPTLGICLGAQLIAKALGANVYSGTVKEIGWSPLTLTEEGRDNFFSPLSSDLTSVLHWHGDTFDLPSQAVRLAKSDVYENQAFMLDVNTLALQFHPEVTMDGMEAWFIGHANEISTTPGINVGQLREDTIKYAARLQSQAQKFWHDWLKLL